MRFKVIISAIKQGMADAVVDAAKGAGATGATIVPGRGTGLHEAKTFFGLSLDAQTDIILMVVEEHFVAGILQAVETAGRFHEPGTGIAFVLPVDGVVGLEKQIARLEEDLNQ